MATPSQNPDPTTLPAVPHDDVRRSGSAGDKDRDADLKRLGELQKEYLDLKRQSESAPAVTQVTPQQAAQARKGDVVREMDAVKRRLGLS